MQNIDHLFYYVMKYPVPLQKESFLYGVTKKDEKSDKIKTIPTFSRGKKNPYIEEYTTFINKRRWLYKSIPWVQEIYLCNSITFNALRQDSDIDIFIIAKEKRLWSARFWSVLFFYFLNLKRNSGTIRKKFCLSFYCTSDAKNIFSLRQGDTDVYLLYRLAHLVPLYLEKKDLMDSMYHENSWMEKFGSFCLSHCITIGTEIFIGNTFFKRGVEFIFSSRIGEIMQHLIKYFWLPFILLKKRNLGSKADGIVISNKVLKFYEDKRKIYNMLYRKHKENL